MLANTKLSKYDPLQIQTEPVSSLPLSKIAEKKIRLKHSPPKYSTLNLIKKGFINQSPSKNLLINKSQVFKYDYHNQPSKISDAYCDDAI